MQLAGSAIQDQLERIQNSRVFETSEVHRRLLSYLADKSLSGEGDRLKEYTIALDAFGKAPTYDPKHDSSVRLQVGRLRQKLLEYYRTEGSHDPVLVDLPKGGFKLVFEPAPSPPAGGAATPRPRPLLRIAVAALAVWAVAATIGWVRIGLATRDARGAWNADLERIWSPFLTGQRPPILCIGTPLFARFPSLGFFRDPLANQWEDLQKSPRFRAVDQAQGHAESMPWFSFADASGASGAFLLARLLGTRRQDVRMTRSNLLSWPEVADNDLVFVGPPKFNIQLEGIPVRQEVVIEPRGIRNLHPRPGEPAFLEDLFLPGPDFNGVTHALISLTPGPSGRGHMLILGGNGGADTLAAAQWLTEPWRATQLVSHLRLPNGAMPDFYQVVLRVEFRHGTPVESSYVFHRILSPR